MTRVVSQRHRKKKLDRAGWKRSRYGRINPGERATVTHWITTELNKMKL